MSQCELAAMPKGKIYALIFYAKSDVVLHFESITLRCLSMRNFDEWNRVVAGLIRDTSVGQSTQIQFDSDGALSSNVCFTHFAIGDVSIVFCHDGVSYTLLASIFDTFNLVFNNVMESQFDDKVQFADGPKIDPKRQLQNLKKNHPY